MLFPQPLSILPGQSIHRLTTGHHSELLLQAVKNCGLIDSNNLMTWVLLFNAFAYFIIRKQTS